MGIRFVDSGNLVDLQDGEVFGALQICDPAIALVDDRLDSVAATLIESINAIHSQGNGLTIYTGTISTSNQVTAPTDPLTAAGLPFKLRPARTTLSTTTLRARRPRPLSPLARGIR